MDSSKPEETHAIVQALRQLVHGLRVTAHSVERELGLTGAQLFVLGEIAAEPNLSIRRLSERTLTDPSSASVVVGKLQEKGLVTRGQDPADRRKSVLSVTPAGQALLGRAPEPYQHKLFSALEEMPQWQRKQLHLGLAALLEAAPLEAAPLDQADAPLFFEGAPEETPKARGRARAKAG
ncbi:MAG: winged helix-turn-helix transcriptional regulator [Sandaracinaceae bacterium]|nr:winged helix-turn-helix transcriptional regulator [Sandaracinaceae bacterium]MBK7777238.1 winged helix-turn-helix transcriptional regulator [Sandaracinaceae bacterium]MBK8408073.1 winged helix-turn-helix transcriptional regulator [Sandaracinaceae bacterium]MBK8593624.1 winged helix-turn-helix transcriptional regulator [Sandaracinaceae bacterium]